MKLTTILLFALCIQVSARVYSQEVSLSVKNSTLKQVFSQIKKQTGYSFLWDEGVLRKAKTVSFTVKGASIEEVMEECLRDQPLTYTIDKRLIVVKAAAVETKISDVIPEPPPADISLSGRVTNAKKEPLDGVSVTVKGTQIGTTTNADGRFLLSVPSANVELVFSFVGYATQTVKAGSRTVFEIVLEEMVSNLSDVVVVGYGTQKKSDLTGAVSSVKGEDIITRRTVKVTDALQGAVAGVTVSRSGSRPGADASIRIRGVTTIGDSNPLVIIDGTPGNINTVNPNDIDNITVLKDGASASIYGSRAASGVILITTKRGKNGEFGLDYNYSGGFESPTRRPRYLDAVGYMRVANEAAWNGNNNTGEEYPIYPKDLIDNYPTLHQQNPDQYPDTDWSGLLLKPSTSRSSHLLGLTAGTKSVRTKASVGYDKAGGLYEGLSYKRVTMRANNDITINKWLTGRLDLNYIRDENQEANTPGGMFLGGFATSPFAALWSDGRVAEGQNGYNPYAQIVRGGVNNNWRNTFRGTLSMDATPLPGLKFSAVFAPELGNYKIKAFKKAIPYTSWNEPDIVKGYVGGDNSTSLSETRNDGFNYTLQGLVNYSKDWVDHNLGFMAGYEELYSFNESLGSGSAQYLLTNFPYLDLGNKNFLTSSGNAYEYAYRSVFGRVVYSYKDRYLFQANSRYDGSSRFAEGHRWGFFPSFSAGWVLSREKFFERVPVVSFLKLRASWGTLGNERIGNYPYQATIGFGSNLMFRGNIPVAVQNAAISKYVIRDISWETTRSIDLGLDAYFFSNTLKLTLDYFRKQTSDMLLPLEIPDYIGLDNPDQNTGKMLTRGWEAELGYHNHWGDLTYAVSFNLTDSRSIMGDLGGTEFIGDQVRFKGSEFAEWYGYRSNGLFQTQDEINNSALLNNQTKVGDIRLVDISGPNGVPDGIISPEYDRVLLGGSLPRYQYGGNLSLGYKGFDLSVVFQGVGRQNTRFRQEMAYLPLQNIPEMMVGKYWSVYNSEQQNREAIYPRLSPSSTTGSSYSTFSDFWLFNGSYFRLKNVTLSYSFPSNIFKSGVLKNLRLYGTATDLFSIDKFPQGWDPESNPSSYWITKTFLLGLSISL